MRRIRVIPIMLIENGRAVITRQFNRPIYVGDPINAIRIFNEKEVDEIIILDITPQSKQREPDYELVAKMASESFMPLAYGGHITSVAQAERVINCGIEKISFNSALFEFPETVSEVAHRFGNQSVVASIDVKKNFFGRNLIKIRGGSKTIKMPTIQVAEHILGLGVGEVLLTNISHDGMRAGYDLFLIEHFRELIDVPIIACGGAGTIEDFVKATRAGASAVAGGAMFFFKGNLNAVLINYPDQMTLKEKLYQNI